MARELRGLKLTRKTCICTKKTKTNYLRVKTGKKLKVYRSVARGTRRGISVTWCSITKHKGWSKGLGYLLILQYKHKQFVETGGERIVQRVGSDRAILYNLLISHISRICLVFQLFTQKLKVCPLRLRLLWAL